MKYINLDNLKKFSYYRLQKPLLTDDKYKNLKLGPKFLYSIFFSRMELSQQNSDSFTDELGRIYIIFPIQTIMEILGVKKDTAIKSLKDLQEYDLISIKKIKEGILNHNRIYVKKISSTTPQSVNNALGYFDMTNVDKSIYYQIPSIFVSSAKYKDMSYEAKILYSVLFDRLKLSFANREIFTDLEGNVFLFMKLTEIMELLNISKHKAINIMGELERYKLIKKERVGGLNNSDRLYLYEFWDDDELSTGISVAGDNDDKKLSTDTTSSIEMAETIENPININYFSEEDNAMVQKTDLDGAKNRPRWCKKSTSMVQNSDLDGAEFRHGKCNIPTSTVQNSDFIYNKNIYNKNSHNELVNQNDIDTIIKKFKNNINYDVLTRPDYDYIFETDLSEEEIENIKKECSINKTLIDYLIEHLKDSFYKNEFKIKNKMYLSEEIRNILLELNFEKIGEIIFRAKKHCHDIKNIKNYILTVAIEVNKNYEFIEYQNIQKIMRGK